MAQICIYIPKDEARWIDNLNEATDKLNTDKSKLVRHAVSYYLRSVNISQLPGPADSDRPVVLEVK